jgi:predicted nucleic acid-binding protein
VTGWLLDTNVLSELRRPLVEEGRKSGHTFSQPDLIIAATALQHGLTIVSRDVSDYQLANVPVLNPWIA